MLWRKFNGDLIKLPIKDAVENAIKKEIIDMIHSEKDKTHYCIFDELYSGTNPIEATKSAYAFLVYLSKFKNVNLSWHSTFFLFKTLSVLPQAISVPCINPDRCR